MARVRVASGSTRTASGRGSGRSSSRRSWRSRRGEGDARARARPAGRAARAARTTRRSSCRTGTRRSGRPGRGRSRRRMGHAGADEPGGARPRALARRGRGCSEAPCPERPRRAVLERRGRGVRCDDEAARRGWSGTSRGSRTPGVNVTRAAVRRDVHAAAQRGRRARASRASTWTCTRWSGWRSTRASAPGATSSATCGKVGGFDRYPPAFGPLGGRLHAVAVEGRARSEYSIPGLGRIAFVRDADAKPPARVHGVARRQVGARPADGAHRPLPPRRTTRICPTRAATTTP